MGSLAAALSPIVERVRQDDIWVIREGQPPRHRQRVALTDARVRQHLEGGPAVGACPMARGGDTTRLALHDIDDHGGAAGWPTVAEAAVAIDDAARARGMIPHPFRSRGGGGIHLYYLWDEPQQARDVRGMLQAILRDAGYAAGTRGVEHGEAEIFPKQDRVPADGWGSMFVLPLAGASVPLEPLADMAPLDRSDAEGYVWQRSEPVPVAEETDEAEGEGAQKTAPVGAGAQGTRRDGEDGSVSLDLLADALAWVPNPNAGEPGEIGYHRGSDGRPGWIEIIFAVHDTDSGPDGLAVADAWSAKSDKHDPDFLAYRVWPYARSDRSERITARSLLALAREHGWDEPSWSVARDFDFTAGAEPETEAPAGAAAITQPLPSGLARTENGEIKATINNVLSVLRHPHALGYKIAFDSFNACAMVGNPDGEGMRPFTDSDYVRIRAQLEGRLGFRPVGRELIRDAAELVSSEHNYDSAKEWISAYIPEWDGVERVHRFLPDYFASEDREYTRAVGLYIWTAMIGRIQSPGCKADMMPIAQGPQGAGKSEALKAMVPCIDYHVEISLTKSDSEIARMLRGKILVEMDELRGLRQRDVEHLKAFVSRRYEEWVPKYKEFSESFPRRCLLFGTTNADQFLADDTGQRRYLPFRCDHGIRVDAIRRDQAQLWAEAYALWQRYGVLHADAERLAEAEHEDYRVEDPWEEIIGRWLEEPDVAAEVGAGDGTRNGDRPLTVPEIAQGALGLRAEYFGAFAAGRIRSVLKEMGYTYRSVQREDGKRARRWCPPSYQMGGMKREG